MIMNNGKCSIFYGGDATGKEYSRTGESNPIQGIVALVSYAQKSDYSRE
jgi:hypothetical protein